MSALPDPLQRLLRERRFDEADALCQARLQANPADGTALRFLLPRLLERGDAARARALSEQAVRAAGHSPDLHLMLAQVCEQMDELASARAAYAQAVELDPTDWVAPLCLADCAQRIGDDEAALSARVQAMMRAERDGALAPDKRLPDHIRARLQRAFVAVQQARGLALDAAMAPLRATYGGDAVSRVTSAADALLGRRPRPLANPLQRPSLLYLPDLPPQPWFDRTQFPFLAQIERQTDAIRAEFLALLDDEADMQPYVDMPDRAPAAPIWRDLNRSLRWRAYHFFRHGRPVAAHLERCPQTAAALAALPLMRVPEHAPEAMFSLLSPKTRIPPHTGVINGRLTVHLPLIVPPHCGALRAGAEAREWQEGECLVFDDSYVHEAWNDSDHVRAVLIFDVWHPALITAEREALSAVITALGEFNRRHGADDPLQE